MEKHTSFLHFVTNVCAIIGGIVLPLISLNVTIPDPTIIHITPPPDMKLICGFLFTVSEYSPCFPSPSAQIPRDWEKTCPWIILVYDWISRRWVNGYKCSTTTIADASVNIFIFERLTQKNINKKQCHLISDKETLVVSHGLVLDLSEKFVDLWVVYASTELNMSALMFSYFIYDPFSPYHYGHEFIMTITKSKNKVLSHRIARIVKVFKINEPIFPAL